MNSANFEHFNTWWTTWRTWKTKNEIPPNIIKLKRKFDVEGCGKKVKQFEGFVLI
jgi:hypothetical protein